MTLSVAEMQRVVREGVPLAAAWGMEVLSAAEGVAMLRLPHHEDLLRPGGTVSGPALMGLAVSRAQLGQLLVPARREHRLVL